MKRDLDLIRDILLDVEKLDNAQPMTLSAMAYDGKIKQEIDISFETSCTGNLRSPSSGRNALPPHPERDRLR